MVSRMFLLLLGFTLASLVNQTYAQCENWNNSPEKEQAENAHTNYRSALKMNDFALAYTEWKIAYQRATAVNWLIDFNYTDGIKIYKHQMKETTDAARKKELIAEILKLYDQVAYCYENGGIKLSNCDEECHKRRAGQLLGRKGF